MCSLDQFHIRLNYKIELRSNSELRFDWMSSRPNQKKCGIKYVTLQSRFLIYTVSADTVKSKTFLIFKNFAIPWHPCYNNISRLEVVKFLKEFKIPVEVKKHLNRLCICYVWITRIETIRNHIINLILLNLYVF